MAQFRSDYHHCTMDVSIGALISLIKVIGVQQLSVKVHGVVGFFLTALIFNLNVCILPVDVESFRLKVCSVARVSYVNIVGLINTKSRP